MSDPVIRNPHTAPVDAPPTLVEFLTARLDEEREVAEREYAYPSGTPRDWSHTAGDADSMLVSMFSPARVLAEVAAKRAIVDLHTPKDRTGMYCCPVCVSWELWVSQEPGEALPLDDAPCATLRALALPYASHPDYRSEWKP